MGGGRRTNEASSPSSKSILDISCAVATAVAECEDVDDAVTAVAVTEDAVDAAVLAFPDVKDT